MVVGYALEMQKLALIHVAGKLHADFRYKCRNRIFFYPAGSGRGARRGLQQLPGGAGRPGRRGGGSQAPAQRRDGCEPGPARPGRKTGWPRGGAGPRIGRGHGGVWTALSGAQGRGFLLLPSGPESFAKCYQLLLSVRCSQIYCGNNLFLSSARHL